MNCFNHPDRPAVAQCLDCGKGLCAECAAAYSIPLCDTCAHRRRNAERRRIIKELVLTFGIGILLAMLFVKLFDGGYHSPFWFDAMLFFVATYVFAGAVAGWRTLTRVAPSRLLLLPIGSIWFLLAWLTGWLAFLLVKLALSFCVGVAMLPIRTVRNILRLVALSRI